MIEISYNIDIIEGEEDNIKVIRRNLKVKKLVYLSDVRNPTQVYNTSGRLLKNKCRVIIKDEGEITINCGYKQMKELLTQKPYQYQSKIGFKLKNNKNVKKSSRGN